MFPLDRSDELCFKVSSNPHQKYKIPEDLILGNASVPEVSNITDNKGKGRQRKTCSMDADETTTSENNKKKMMHRNIERQRRQEMSTLHASLRSLLPLEFIKGKRSISDQMNEAVNYIKHLEKKIKEVGAKRDELKKLSNFSAHDSEIGSSDHNITPSSVVVSPCLVGVEIVYSCRYWEQDLPLSRLLEVLLDEGLSVVNCVSTRVNNRLLHTIQAEVKDPSCFNLCGLQQKLTQLK